MLPVMFTAVDPVAPTPETPRFSCIRCLLPITCTPSTLRKFIAEAGPVVPHSVSVVLLTMKKFARRMSSSERTTMFIGFPSSELSATVMLFTGPTPALAMNRRRPGPIVLSVIATLLTPQLGPFGSRSNVARRVLPIQLWSIVTSCAAVKEIPCRPLSDMIESWTRPLENVSPSRPEVHEVAVDVLDPDVVDLDVLRAFDVDAVLGFEVGDVGVVAGARVGVRAPDVHRVQRDVGAADEPEVRPGASVLRRVVRRAAVAGRVVRPEHGVTTVDDHVVAVLQHEGLVDAVAPAGHRHVGVVGQGGQEQVELGRHVDRAVVGHVGGQLEGRLGARHHPRGAEGDGDGPRLSTEGLGCLSPTSTRSHGDGHSSSPSQGRRRRRLFSATRIVVDVVGDSSLATCLQRRR